MDTIIAYQTRQGQRSVPAAASPCRCRCHQTCRHPPAASICEPRLSLSAASRLPCRWNSQSASSGCQTVRYGGERTSRRPRVSTSLLFAAMTVWLCAADERGPSPQRSPAAAPLSPSTSTSPQLTAWQLPAAALEALRPPPPLPLLARQKGSPKLPPASVQHQMGSAALPSTPPTFSSMQTRASALPLASPPAFPAQHQAGLSGSQQGLPAAPGALQHHTESATMLPRVMPRMPPPVSATQRGMGPSGSPPMPTWDTPKPASAAHSPASASAIAAISAAAPLVSPPAPASAAPLFHLEPGVEPAQVSGSSRSWPWQVA